MTRGSIYRLSTTRINACRNITLLKNTIKPHFTQYFASVAYDLIKSGVNEEADEFTEGWMRRIILPQTDVFQDIYDQPTNSQRAALQAIASSGGEGIFSESVKIQYKLPVSSSLNEALKALQKKGLIY